jgi:hypothetical protein
MTTRIRPVVYRPLSRRITTMLWGLAVVAFGAGVIARLNGYTFDMELLAILTLAVLGAWILVSAVVALVRDR